MSIRNAVRAWAPQVLALALALVLAHPLASELPDTSPGLAHTGGAATVATASEVATGNVAVSVPAVAFTLAIQVRGGRVQLPLLVNVAEPSGHATLLGIPGCQVDAEPGVVAWLECKHVRRQRALTVVVRLDDGRVISHTFAPTFSCEEEGPAQTSAHPSKARVKADDHRCTEPDGPRDETE